MAAVKWIKITTDMFDNRKIKHLRKLPEGDSIVLIWVMLLTMAGRCNANGMIFLTENIPYTTKMLADELDFEENTVQLALQSLEHLGMIVIDNGYYIISGWEKHQNIEGMEKIREQTRKRVAKHREQKKLQCNVTVTQCNAIEEEVEEEKEEDKKESKKESESVEQPAHTAEPISYESLVKKYGKSFVDERIQRAKRYTGTTIETVAKWCAEDFKKNSSKYLSSIESYNSFPQNTYDFEALEKEFVLNQEPDPDFERRRYELQARLHEKYKKDK